MPAIPPPRQPAPCSPWFASQAGEALLASEAPSLHEALQWRPGLPWLGLGVAGRPAQLAGTAGFWLQPHGEGWTGDLRCAGQFPLASESIGCVFWQHVASPATSGEWLAECARVLVPGGKLWLFALNPLSPYRRHWFGQGVDAREPGSWRRALRRAGLEANAVAEGLGAVWQVAVQPARRMGAGVRAAYLLVAEKRRIPVTPVPAAGWKRFQALPELGHGSLASGEAGGGRKPLPRELYERN